MFLKPRIHLQGDVCIFQVTGNSLASGIAFGILAQDRAATSADDIVESFHFPHNKTTFQ